MPTWTLGKLPTLTAFDMVLGVEDFIVPVDGDARRRRCPLCSRPCDGLAVENLDCDGVSSVSHVTASESTMLLVACCSRLSRSFSSSSRVGGLARESGPGKWSSRCGVLALPRKGRNCRGGRLTRTSEASDAATLPRRDWGCDNAGNMPAEAEPCSFCRASLSRDLCMPSVNVSIANSAIFPVPSLPRTSWNPVAAWARFRRRLPQFNLRIRSCSNARAITTSRPACESAFHPKGSAISACTCNATKQGSGFRRRALRSANANCCVAPKGHVDAK